MDWAILLRQRTELAEKLTTDVAELLTKRDLSEAQTKSLLAVIDAFCETIENMVGHMSLDESAEDHQTSVVADLDDISLSMAEDVANRLAELRLRRLSADRALASR